jgi:hypothetical protein
MRARNSGLSRFLISLQQSRAPGAQVQIDQVIVLRNGEGDCGEGIKAPDTNPSRTKCRVTELELPRNVYQSSATNRSTLD